MRVIVIGVSLQFLSSNMEKSVKRSRAPNWERTERALLKELVKGDISIIECKLTDTNSNTAKIKAWQEVHKRFREINGRDRSLAELRQQWRCMKMSTKNSISTHHQGILKTGGEPKLPSPSPKAVEMIEIIPLKYEEDHNQCDSNGPPIMITSDEFEVVAHHIDKDLDVSTTAVLENDADPALCEVQDDPSSTSVQSTPRSIGKCKRKRQHLKDEDSYKYSIQKVAEKRSAEILEMRRQEHKLMLKEHEQKMKNLREEAKINELRLEILKLEKKEALSKIK